jgi:CheY-like chemotaxis protein
VEAQSPGEGRGATFVVALPLAAPVEEAARHGNGALAGDGALPPRLDGVSVLLVEDEPDTRDGVCLLLSRAGARVIGVGSAEEALVALQALRPDVLVCDIGLPGEDGYSLLKRIRAGRGEKEPFIPAIALTAYAQERDRQRAHGAGFHSHVAKPVEPDELLRVLARAVGSGLRLERPKLVAGGEEL